MKDKLVAVASMCLFVAVVLGIWAWRRGAGQAEIDARRELFTTQGVQTPCTHVDDEVEVVKEVTTRGKVRVSEYPVAWYVKCRYEAEGQTWNDRFKLTFDPGRALDAARHRIAMLNATDKLLRPTGGAATLSAQLRAASEDIEENLFMVTYLRGHPQRSVLGPVRAAFPRAPNAHTTDLAIVSGLFALLGLVLLVLSRARFDFAPAQE